MKMNYLEQLKAEKDQYSALSFFNCYLFTETMHMIDT